MEFVDVLELEEQAAQSELSNKAINRYIEVSSHLINMEEISAARKILISVGFTKKSVEMFIKRSRFDAEINISEDFKLMIKGKVSKKYLN
jgi:hypothetical protein